MTVVSSPLSASAADSRLKPRVPQKELQDEATLWPLPLTSYEQYMFLDDRPSHPMAFCIELLLEGTLLRSAVEAALAVAISRHPLLRAQVVTRFGRRPVWQSSDRETALEWLSPEQYANLKPQPFLDLKTMPGLRVWAVADPASPRLVFQFHHAAVDGVGALEFIGDLLAVYAQQTSEADEEIPELEPVDFNKLKIRGQFGNQSRKTGDWIPGFLRHTWENISSFPASLKPANCRRPTNVDRAAIPPYVTRILDSRALQAVKKEAATRGMTPNEIYTAVMLQTFHRWNAKQSPRAKKQKLRLCMPISLRSPAVDDSPSANIISYMLINCSASMLDNFDATLRHVHTMSRDIIGTPDGPTFVRNLAILRNFPGMLKLLVNAPICFGTGILANVGDVRRQFRSRFPLVRGRVKAGSVTMTGLLGAAPVRRGSGVATSVGTYGRQLFINMNYDRELLAAEDAEQLIDLFVSGLMERVPFENDSPVVTSSCRI